MAIIIPGKGTSPVYYPDKNYQIVKYLDITKFLSLIQKRALFFSRLDLLEDHFEGSVPKANYQGRYQFIAETFKQSEKFKNSTPEQIKKSVEKLYWANERFKALSCICCWNISEIESAALWKIYSSFNNGIMLTSKISNVIEAFKDTEEQVYLSKVKYIDHNSDIIPDGNSMYPILHKNKAYQYEEELRFIHTVKFEAGLKYDWSKEEIETGKYLKLDIDKLIDDVTISPYAPDWFHEMVKNLCEVYGFKKPILKSQISKSQK